MIIKEHKPYTLQDNNRAQTLHFTGQLKGMNHTLYRTIKGMNLTLYMTIKGHEPYTLQDN